MPDSQRDLNDGDVGEPIDGATDDPTDETQDDYADSDEAEDVEAVGDESAYDAGEPEAEEPAERKVAPPTGLPDILTAEEAELLEGEAGSALSSLILKVAQRAAMQAVAAQNALETGMMAMGVTQEYLSEYGPEAREYAQNIPPQDRHKPEAVVATVLGGVGLRALKERDENGNVDIGTALRRAADAFDRQKVGQKKPPVPPRRTQGQLQERGSRPAQVAAPAAPPQRRGGDREAEALAKRMGITVEQARAAVNIARQGGR